MPNFYLIAGPNGAGKTTFAREWLPKRIAWENFLNADIIAVEMCPENPRISGASGGASDA